MVCGLPALPPMLTLRPSLPGGRPPGGGRRGRSAPVADACWNSCGGSSKGVVARRRGRRSSWTKNTACFALLRRLFWGSGGCKGVQACQQACSRQVARCGSSSQVCCARANRAARAGTAWTLARAGRTEASARSLYSVRPARSTPRLAGPPRRVACRRHCCVTARAIAAQGCQGAAQLQEAIRLW